MSFIISIDTRSVSFLSFQESNPIFASLKRLADVVSRFKAVEQVSAITHNDAFTERAGHVTNLAGEAGVSRVSIER